MFTSLKFSYLYLCCSLCKFVNTCMNKEKSANMCLKRFRKGEIPFLIVIKCTELYEVSKITAAVFVSTIEENQIFPVKKPM